MAKKLDKNNFVYSTNPNFEFDLETNITKTIQPNKQELKITLDTKHRAGKKVTLISGYVGEEKDLESLAKLIKTKLGVGGSSKDGLIIIQGDYVMKCKELLQKEFYKVK